MLAIHAFTRQKTADLKAEKQRIATALKKAEDEKRTLISQRAAMITQNLFDDHSKNQFDKQIDELSDLITDLQYRRKSALDNNKSQIISFYKFLELRENLGLYWKLADHAKKAIFSKICVSNLAIKGQKVA